MGGINLYKKDLLTINLSYTFGLPAVEVVIALHSDSKAEALRTRQPRLVEGISLYIADRILEATLRPELRSASLRSEYDRVFKDLTVLSTADTA